MAIVRHATQAEFARMIELGAEMHLEGRYSRLPYNKARLLVMANSLHSSGDGAFFVSVAQSEIIGMAAVQKVSYYFCDAQYVTDLFIYVRPEHRGGFSFFRLVKAIETWAKEQGIAEVKLGVSNPLNVDTLSSLYEAMGYNPSGLTFCKRVL